MEISEVAKAVFLAVARNVGLYSVFGWHTDRCKWRLCWIRHRVTAGHGVGGRNISRR